MFFTGYTAMLKTNVQDEVFPAINEKSFIKCMDKFIQQSGVLRPGPRILLNFDYHWLKSMVIGYVVNQITN
jgi:hypothetical protein